jgi:homeobox-leucine zipper protein
MYEELNMLSPMVPTREFCFLRYCRHLEQGLWAIADVSVDLSREIQFQTHSGTRRLPSGCLIQEIPNGYSKVYLETCGTLSSVSQFSQIIIRI